MTLRSARIELVARRALDDRASAAVALGWYRRAHDWASTMADVCGMSAGTVVGVVAALSPLNGWESQLEWTPKILAAWNHDAHGSTPHLVATAHEWLPGPGLGTNKRKAARILCGEDPDDVLGGSKVRAFFANILGDSDSVCIDRHAWAIATGDFGSVCITPKRYRDTVAAFQCAAANLRAAFPRVEGLTPAGVQALTWEWWRANEGDRF